MGYQYQNNFGEIAGPFKFLHYKPIKKEFVNQHIYADPGQTLNPRYNKFS